MKRGQASQRQSATRSRRWARRNGLAIAVVCAVVFVAVYVVLFREPGWLYGPDLSKLTPEQRVTAIDDVHGRMFQFATGLVAIVALAFTGLNFWLSREGHVTDRFTKAIEQLGSASTDVRLGAIYSLERIMADSPRDHPTIVEVLAAFVREHTKLAGQAKRRSEHEEQGGSGVPPPYTDAQAALTVLGRRPSGREERGDLNLQYTDLMGADLTSANLTNANLLGADLTGATLTDADLSRAIMRHADLSGAFASGVNLSLADLEHAELPNALLSDANLAGVDLGYAVLSNVFVDHADLTRANLTDAQLNAADLTGTDLTGAKLTGANLAAANLTGAKLHGAIGAILSPAQETQMG